MENFPNKGVCLPAWPLAKQIEKKQKMKTSIAISLTSLLILAHSFAFSNPKPQRQVNVRFAQGNDLQSLVTKPFEWETTQTFIFGTGERDFGIDLKKGDKYSALLKVGLERKNRRNKNA